ncbi:hypothetical protein N825_21435 [Skermanella stibiiresistens SB22]|uniref:DUF2382 domain-containing protein n=1 Tax=Skermanella stibiiresistens SB22 TaxID=1385369 RepID=W9H097_9PROT|nr:YsnF/AvaK domain-containing protein [Skermanella stibiiresistens]EWY37153.1 hypothetical protein N825_21435 [Skermanella stibiiresistens SB22]
MTTSIIGLFETREIATKVQGALTKSGFKKEAIEILNDVTSAKISKRLVEAGYEKDKADEYGAAMRDGGALIVAEAADDAADDALATMRKFNALSPDALQELVGDKPSDEAEGATESAQVIEEELEVGTAKTVGGKRLAVSVSEHEVQETVILHDETVEVERTPVDRVMKASEADKAFQDRSIEMVEITEKPVVTKQAHVIEEVSLAKKSKEREVTVTGTVRHQDVTVEEMDRQTKTVKKA